MDCKPAKGLARIEGNEGMCFADHVSRTSAEAGWCGLSIHVGTYTDTEIFQRERMMCSTARESSWILTLGRETADEE